MRKLFLIPVIIFMLGCTRETIPYLEITDQCEFPQLITNPCFWGIVGHEFDEIIFNTNGEFSSFMDSIRIFPVNLNCDTASPPAIDFNTFTLLGKFTQGAGCSVAYERKVLKDTHNKKIIYEINISYSGFCDMLITNRNWVLVPKIPDDYSVDFVVHEK